MTADFHCASLDLARDVPGIPLRSALHLGSRAWFDAQRATRRIRPQPDARNLGIGARLGAGVLADVPVASCWAEGGDRLGGRRVPRRPAAYGAADARAGSGGGYGRGIAGETTGRPSP
jgi:hypothetical protein